jgi:Cys-tRNA synthase (O-phospho-L-seryl-tRNA:Cys-tRNA synthase)
MLFQLKYNTKFLASQHLFILLGTTKLGNRPKAHTTVTFNAKSLKKCGSREEGRNTYGARRIKKTLARKDIVVSRRRIVRLMQEAGLGKHL